MKRGPASDDRNSTVTRPPCSVHYPSKLLQSPLRNLNNEESRFLRNVWTIQPEYAASNMAIFMVTTLYNLVPYLGLIIFIACPIIYYEYEHVSFSLLLLLYGSLHRSAGTVQQATDITRTKYTKCGLCRTS
jgi:hypothetical protein